MGASDTESALSEAPSTLTTPFSIAARSAASTIPISQRTRNLDSRKPVGFVPLPRRKHLAGQSQIRPTLSQDIVNEEEATQKEVESAGLEEIPSYIDRESLVDINDEGDGEDTDIERLIDPYSPVPESIISQSSSSSMR